MVIDSRFWQNRKVFLTGHTGFKGSWLVLWLYALGAQVYGYALQPPTQPSLYEACSIRGLLVDEIEGDVRDLHLLTSTIQSIQPEIVFHLAAQPLVRNSYKDPVETYEVNVLGSVNILEAVRASSAVRVFINVTTDKCYENHEWCYPYRESDPMGGHDPYSASKACAEILTRSYRSSFFSSDHKVAIATARAGNVIGGGDWAEARLLPDCIRALMAKKPIYLRYPQSIRPWQHVLEPLAGYLLLAQKAFIDKAFANSWNFGPDADSEATVAMVAQQVIDCWGKGELCMDSSSVHPHEAGILRLDTTKARTILNWRSCWSLEETIEKTVNWYYSWQSEKDMRQYSLQQIFAYQAVCR
ncbi:MAG: CDP-glucose 4,6-dehydratase [Cyanobacteria bacterium P01_G01_bin.54]